MKTGEHEKPKPRGLTPDELAEGLNIYTKWQSFTPGRSRGDALKTLEGWAYSHWDSIFVDLQRANCVVCEENRRKLIEEALDDE